MSALCKNYSKHKELHGSCPQRVYNLGEQIANVYNGDKTRLAITGAIKEVCR